MYVTLLSLTSLFTSYLCLCGESIELCLKVDSCDEFEYCHRSNRPGGM